MSGSAWKIPAADFAILIEGSRPFSTSMDRYLLGYLNMLGQIAACNRLRNSLERYRVGSDPSAGGLHQVRTRILNRAGLESLVCECYAVASQQFGESLKISLPANTRKR